MFEKIKGIEITGRCFGTQPRALTLFPLESHRISVIYGKNGSGKSTISKALYDYSIKNADSDLAVQLCAYQNNGKIKTTGDTYLGSSERIFVFNEDYIKRNVGIKKDGLDTIVLLGQQVEADKRILELNEQINTIEASITEAENELKKKNGETLRLKKGIEKELKKDGGWADQARLIKRRKNNEPVTDQVIKQICAAAPTKSSMELRSEFQELFSKLKSFAEDRIYPRVNFPKPYVCSDEFKLLQLLSQQLEKPTLDDKDESLLTAIAHDLSKTSQLKKDLESGIDTCPYCHQGISNTWKDTLLKAIMVVLDKPAKEHSSELRTVKISSYSFDISPYSDINLQLCVNIKTQLDKVNELIEQYNEHIERKIQFLYTPITIPSLNLCDETKSLLALIKQLDDAVNSYNAEKRGSSKIQQRLLEINLDLAHCDINALLSEYQSLLTRCEQLKNSKVELIKRQANLKEKLNEWQEIKKNTTICIKQINNALEYVFFSKERMEIVSGDGIYKIKSKGMLVSPESTSCGERNIIALCYFFSQIMEGLVENSIYSREVLLIIDDPISSFDQDNRIGILSFLKLQISQILKGNSNSRVVFLSHDTQTVSSIVSFSEEIRLTLSKLQVGTPSNQKFINCAKLENLAVESESIDVLKNEYSTLLNIVYSYACNVNFDKYELFIGNAMRRLLEAFATFEYQKGIVDVSLEPVIWETISEKQRSFFENFMYRFILHGESHLEDQAKSVDFDFYIHNSKEEKIKTAQYVLCLIYTLNPKHLEMRFVGQNMPGKVAIEQIKKWCDSIN